MAFNPRVNRTDEDPAAAPTTQMDPSKTKLQSKGLPPGGPAMYFGPEGGGMPPMPTPMDVEGLGPGIPPAPAPPSLSDTSNVLAANPGGMGMDMNGAGVMADGSQLGPGSIAPGSASPGGLPASMPWSPQDKMMAAYLAATLGGSVGTMFKRPAPPPPISPMGPVNPAPASTPTASQAALGLASNRNARKGGFGGRG